MSMLDIKRVMGKGMFYWQFNNHSSYHPLSL